MLQCAVCGIILSLVILMLILLYFRLKTAEIVGSVFYGGRFTVFRKRFSETVFVLVSHS